MRCCRLSLALAVLVVVGLSTSWADEIYNDHYLAGCPDGARGQHLVVTRDLHPEQAVPPSA